MNNAQKYFFSQSETMKIINVVRGEFSDKNEFAPKKPDGKIVGLTASKFHMISFFMIIFIFNSSLSCINFGFVTCQLLPWIFDDI